MFDSKLVKNEIVKWIKDYFYINGNDCVAVIGISGGKDSSIVAALCVEALGKDRVFGVLMPQGNQHDINISYELVELLGINYIKVNIKDVVNEIYNSLYDGFGQMNNHEILNSVVKNNTPARVRMTVLYAVSAQIGGRVANTCNLSEDWVGYSTKYGDSVGDFSPLSNLTVTEVKLIGEELKLPSKFIHKIPIDGLCGMTDENNLGFTYEVLDKYIRFNICDDVKIKNKIDKMHSYNLHKLNPMPSYNLKTQ